VDEFGGWAGGLAGGLMRARATRQRSEWLDDRRWRRTWPIELRRSHTLSSNPIHQHQQHHLQLE